MTAALPPPAPPPPHPAARASVASRLASPVLAGATLLAVVAVLHLRDPHQSGSYGFCPWLLLTGTYCPGCGGLRAVHDLTHGDVAAAVSSNLLVVALVPLAVTFWVLWMRARWRGRAHTPPLPARPVLWSLAVLVPAFTLLRNLDVGTWLAP